MADKLMKRLSPAVTIENEGSGSVGRIFSSLRGLMSRTGWMRSADSYIPISGAEFGRSIEKELKALGQSDGPGVLAVSIRRRMRAIVITPEHYEEMRQMRDKVQELVAAQAKTEVQDARDHFESLYSRITSEQSRAASDALFSVTGEELADSYGPGATETVQ